jgi:hypothetical protein
MVPQFNRLGSELAAQPPAWAQALGPVPSDTDNQEQWRLLAAEVAVFREQYRIPVTEPTAIPARHWDKPLGADLNLDPPTGDVVGGWISEAALSGILA